MHVRLAVVADIPRLIALDSFAEFHPPRRNEIAGWVAAGACHVAIDGGALGYVALVESFFHQPCIEMLMVAADARGQGVGTTLLRHAARSVTGKLWCTTNRSNAPMRRLLGRSGFVFAGEVDHLDPGDPELVFVRLPG